MERRPRPPRARSPSGQRSGLASGRASSRSAGSRRQPPAEQLELKAKQAVSDDFVRDPSGGEDDDDALEAAQKGPDPLKLEVDTRAGDRKDGEDASPIIDIRLQGYSQKNTRRKKQGDEEHSDSEEHEVHGSSAQFHEQDKNAKDSDEEEAREDAEQSSTTSRDEGVGEDVGEDEDDDTQLARMSDLKKVRKELSSCYSTIDSMRNLVDAVQRDL